MEDRLDLSSDPSPGPQGGEPPAGPRRFVGVRFDCCGVYARIYVNRDGTAYEGRCPRCGKPIRLKIGPGGTDCRFFIAS